VATVGVAYAFAVTMIGTTMPTPLYPIYEQRYHFSALTVTLVYSVYGLGVMTALVLFSRGTVSSSHRGQSPDTPRSAATAGSTDSP
jgi:predicted MFS family arabinose efflux permease